MGWQYTPYAVLLILVAGVSASIALYAWRRRSTPGARTLSVLLAAVFVWSLGYALEIGTTDLGAKVFWAKVEYLGIVTVPVAWLTFALRYTGRERWLTSRNLALIYVVPAITLLLAATNEAHGLIWNRTALDPSGPFLAVGHGPWFWVHWLYSYLLVLVGTFFLVSMLLRSPPLYRKQTVALLLGAAAPWIGNGIYVLKLNPVPNLDLTPFAFLISGAAISWSLFRFRFLEIVPVARDALIEGMSDGVIVADPLGRVLDLNPAAQRILGCPASEAVGRNLSDVSPRLAPFLEERGEEGRVPGEIRLESDSGWRDYEVTLSTLRDRRERRTGHLLVLHDITERKRDEAALRESEELYRAVVEQAAEGIFLFDAETKRVLETNTAFEELLGYTAEELSGMQIYGFIDHDRQSIDENVRRIISEKRASIGERRYRCKDGTLLDFEVSAGRIFYGGQEAICAVVRDVTERKRSEEMLREAEERFRTLVEQIPAIIYIEDIETQATLYDSPQIETILGYPADTYEKDPHYWAKILHPDDRERVMTTEARSVEKGKFRHEYRVFARDGRVVWLRDEAAIVRDEEGNPRFWQGVIFDITERKRVEGELLRQKAELTRSNAELEHFAYLIAHDLRAPLRGINGFSHILLEDYADRLDEEGRGHLRRVRDAAGRMGQLIDELLDLSRLTRMEMHRESVDLSAMASEIFAELQTGQPHRSAEVVVSDGLHAEGDRRLLRIALANLLENAWKFTSREPHARIEFGAQDHDGERVYFVRDNGVGFDMAYADKLFGAFQRLHPADEFEGTGIGLATVQRIVERHGGRVWAQSAEGEGATFYFTLQPRIIPRF